MILEFQRLVGRDDDTLESDGAYLDENGRCERGVSSLVPILLRRSPVETQAMPLTLVSIRLLVIEGCRRYPQPLLALQT